MDREPLARVEYQPPDRFGAPATWAVDVCGRKEYFSREEYAKERMEEVNIIASAWLEREVKKAVEEERERCAKIAEEEYEPKESMPIELYAASIRDAKGFALAVIAATKKSIAATIRSTPGKEKNNA